jgi:hypothetical protein
MSRPYGATGTKIYIADAGEPDTQSEFEALVWTKIGGVENLGEFGDESSILTATDLEDERVFKAKGPRDAGTLAITCFQKPDDSGQDALIAAEATKYNYPFKVVLPNRTTPSGTDQVEYFIGLVVSKRLNVADAQNIVRRMFNVAINGEIITVDAT